MKNKIIYYFLLVICISLLISGCGFIKSETEEGLIDFSLENQIGKSIIDSSTKTITVEVFGETDISNLEPTIIVQDGYSVEPESGIAQDFSEPVEYTLEHTMTGSTSIWTVNVIESDIVYKDNLDNYSTGNELPPEFEVSVEGDWFIAEENEVKILQRPNEADQRILDFFCSIDRNNGYTFSFKFKGVGSWIRLFADDGAVDHTSENYSFNMKSQWLRKFEDGGSSYTLDDAKDLDVIDSGDWNEMEINFNSTEIKIYINGTEVASTDNTDIMNIQKIRFRSARYNALAKIKDIYIQKN